MREALLILLLVLLVLDWRQTLVIARPGGWVEGWNPILRRLIDCYRYAGVHGWFAFVIVVCALGAWLLWTDPALPWIAGLCCALQAAPVVNNYSKGIRP
jgi:hypothetical protein